MKNYFATWELLPWELWLQVGEAGRKLVDPVLLRAANLVRMSAGVPFTVNTKGDGGRNASCVRLPHQKYYSPTSRHSLNRKYSTQAQAMDFVSSLDPRAIHAIILKDPEMHCHIRFIEIDRSWVHIDVEQRNHTSGIALWSPERDFVSIDVYIQELKEKGFW
ncbi:endolysin [Vibrio phage K436]